MASSSITLLVMVVAKRSMKELKVSSSWEMSDAFNSGDGSDAFLFSKMDGVAI